MPPREWTIAKAQFAIMFGERFQRRVEGSSLKPTPHRGFLIGLIEERPLASRKELYDQASASQVGAVRT